MEKTLVIIKPNAQQFACSILQEIQKEFELLAQWSGTMSLQQAQDLYQEHINKSFYQEILDFMTSDVVTVFAFGGECVVDRIMQACGMEADPALCDEGTVRARYGEDLMRNAVHRSATIEDAKRELKIFFPHMSDEGSD